MPSISKATSQSGRAGQGWRESTEAFLHHRSKLGMSHEKLEGLLEGAVAVLA